MCVWLWANRLLSTIKVKQHEQSESSPELFFFLLIQLCPASMHIIGNFISKFFQTKYSISENLLLLEINYKKKF